MIVTTNDTLRRMVGARTLATFERSIPGSEILHGYPLQFSRRLVLLHVLREFHLDGYALLRVGDIARVRRGQSERFFARMLRQEGVSKLVGIAHELQLSDVNSALASLKAQKKLLTVECEAPDVGEYYAGRVQRLTASTASLHTFDACGKWGAQPTRVVFDAISLVTWDNEYLSVFERYLPKRRQS